VLRRGSGGSLNRYELHKIIVNKVGKEQLEKFRSEAEKTLDGSELKSGTVLQCERERGIRDAFIKNGDVVFYEPYYLPGKANGNSEDERRYTFEGHKPDFVDLKRTPGGLHCAFDPHKFNGGDTNTKWFYYSKIWSRELGFLYPVIITGEEIKRIGHDERTVAVEEVTSEPVWRIGAHEDVDVVEKKFMQMLEGLKRMGTSEDSREELYEAITIAKVLESNKSLLNLFR